VIDVNVTVNGQERTGTVEARKTLADFLRQDLLLTGTHVGCEHGVCGACTILLDGEPVRSCLMLAAQVDGADITTIEGLGGENGALHPVQEAFRDAHGFQCGFCTPGFMMTTVALLEENPEPSELEIREAISGNICRCTGYGSIVAGVQLAAQRLKEA
jgi:carbon-monoxide dehydrogenase small subunit